MMSKEKQIEEMAWDLCDIPKHPSIKLCEQCGNKHCHAMYYAERAYNAGYRKQSEWISVEERLPESSDIECLLFLDNEQIVIGWYHVSAGVFVEGGIAMLNKVTHWMPLPEAPKMKGGAE